MTGRIVKGEEAQALGLVTKLAEDPVETALLLAKELATRSPDAIAATKKLYQDTWIESDAVGLDVETKLQKKLMGSMNQLSAVGQAMGVPLPFKSVREDL